MCGLFGFSGTKPDIAFLTELAHWANTRGPHAFGYAWANDKIHIEKHPVPFSDRSDLNKVSGSTAVIGNCRLATSGEWWNNDNNQPILARESALVHNGNVYNWRDIYDFFGYSPTTECDSEALIILVQELPDKSLQRRCEHAIKHIDQSSPLAMMYLENNQLAVIRNGHPLYKIERSEGTYFCSRRAAPDAELIDNETAYVYE